MTSRIKTKRWKKLVKFYIACEFSMRSAPNFKLQNIILHRYRYDKVWFLLILKWTSCSWKFFGALFTNLTLIAQLICFSECDNSTLGDDQETSVESCFQWIPSSLNWWVILEAKFWCAPNGNDIILCFQNNKPNSHRTMCLMDHCVPRILLISRVGRNNYTLHMLIRG